MSRSPSKKKKKDPEETPFIYGSFPFENESEASDQEALANCEPVDMTFIANLTNDIRECMIDIGFSDAATAAEARPPPAEDGTGSQKVEKPEGAEGEEEEEEPLVLPMERLTRALMEAGHSLKKDLTRQQKSMVRNMMANEEQIIRANAAKAAAKAEKGDRPRPSHSPSMSPHKRPSFNSPQDGSPSKGQLDAYRAETNRMQHTIDKLEQTVRRERETTAKRTYFSNAHSMETMKTIEKRHQRDSTRMIRGWNSQKLQHEHNRNVLTSIEAEVERLNKQIRDLTEENMAYKKAAKANEIAQSRKKIEWLQIGSKQKDERIAELEARLKRMEAEREITSLQKTGTQALSLGTVAGLVTIKTGVGT